jgi:hypothetical protein
MKTKPYTVSPMDISSTKPSSNSFNSDSATSTSSTNDGTVSTNTSGYEQIDVVYTENQYSSQSSYLTRELQIIFSNTNGDSFTLSKNKMSVTGSKYIGIQQDQFTIILQNINFFEFAKAVNRGYKLITVTIDSQKLFVGTIKSINTGRENIVERTIELNCLMKVTDLLSDLVTPITVNSSINLYAVLNQVMNTETGISISQIPVEFKDIRFDKEQTFSGYRKTVIDDIIKVTNDLLNRTNNLQVPWIDYEYDQEGTLNLFTPYTIKEVLNVQPWTGLIDAPTISEDSISFTSIYKFKLVPGRVVKLKNALFRTLGNQSAFIYGWDPDGLYVITEVRYEASNYPNVYKASCKARPLSKYNNFTASLGG